MVPGTLPLGVKRPGREADHSPPSSAKVKNAWSYTSTPKYVFMVWCLVKHRDNFTFTFTVPAASPYRVKNLKESRHHKHFSELIGPVHTHTHTHIYKHSPFASELERFLKLLE
jgi:hypothetical protein